VLATLVMPRSADSTVTGDRGRCCCPGTVSVVPGGTLTVAVLIRLPEALAATCAWKVTVTLPPEGIVTEPVSPVSVATKLAVLALALTCADHIGDRAQARGQGVGEAGARGHARAGVA
jgi:hypothetical protein